MKFFLLVVCILFFFFSCSRNTDSVATNIGYKGSDSLSKAIKIKEKNLQRYYQHLMNGDIAYDSLPSKMINELMQNCQLFYRLYPQDSLSPYYIDKIHQLFMQEKQYSYAVDWVDTLLYHYPNYRNKTLILYSAGTSTDMSLMDTNRVKRYYNRLLNECPKLKIDVKNQILHRLKYLELPYLEYLKKQTVLK